MSMGSDFLYFLIMPVLAGLGIARITRVFRSPKDVPFLDRFVLDAALGLGLLSVVFFAMAALHIMIPPRPFVVCVIFMLIGLALVLWDQIVSRVEWRNAGNTLEWRSVVWVVLLGCLALLVMIPALAPPTGGDWDSLAYHLAVPKLYLEHGGFYYIDFMSHSNFPMLVEMLYTPALAMNSPAGAKLVHYTYGVLLVLAVVMLVRKHSGVAAFSERGSPSETAATSGATRLAALAIAGMPIMMWEATTAYIDLATALYTVVAVYLLLDYLDKSELRSLIWCGAAAGFAASTKMTGLALIPMLAVWLVIDRLTRPIPILRQAQDAQPQERGQAIKHALLLCGVGLLVCSPWYIKSLIYTGNPVYPFFYSTFGGKDWTQELAQNYTMLQAKFGMGHDFASFVLLPFDLTFHSEKFYDRPGLFIGPILLVAVPLLMFARKWSRKLKGLLVFFVAQMVVWFALTQQSRYLIPAFAILAVIIAAVAYSEERLKATRVALYVVFGATALFGILVMSFSIADAWQVVRGQQTLDTYLALNLPLYGVQEWINERTPSSAKIALFGDTRGFYLDRDYVWADWGHNKRFTRKFASVDEFITYLKSQGVTHAMVNEVFMPKREEATGTAKLVYESIDQKRFKGWCMGRPGTRTGVYEVK